MYVRDVASLLIYEKESKKCNIQVHSSSKNVFLFHSFIAIVYFNIGIITEHSLELSEFYFWNRFSCIQTTGTIFAIISHI